LDGSGGKGRKAQQDKDSDWVMENLLAKKAEAECKRTEAKKMLVKKLKDAASSNCGRKQSKNSSKTRMNGLQMQ
jgi:hypothetical protein